MGNDSSLFREGRSAGLTPVGTLSVQRAMSCSAAIAQRAASRKRAILFVDNEAACAALTTGTSRVPGALLLVYALWAIAAEHDIGLWTERVPTGVNPADLPSRSKGLPFPTQPSVELASLTDILSAYDFSWVLLQKTNTPTEAQKSSSTSRLPFLFTKEK